MIKFKTVLHGVLEIINQFPYLFSVKMKKTYYQNPTDNHRTNSTYNMKQRNS